ncbi:hypothetical protein D5085_04765 [Ectothiorhodospiraceae bacterium BW-2]|nr:hypothetical protein D5085_04765 [Ectothiorhodospiraceae bacterium BW-2]
METAKLKKFAQFARRSLLDQVSAKLKRVLAENSAARRECAVAIKRLEEAIKGHGNDYLREFRTKLTSHKNHLEAVSISASSSQSEKTKALKETLKITRMITEMEAYEREVLYPLATEQVKIDLDDGVKVNYPKLGAALKKIVGLEATEE